MRIAAPPATAQACEAPELDAVDPRACPLLPCAWGDVFDKLTILQIKARRFTDPQRLAHVRRELEAVQAVANRIAMSAPLAALVERLADINAHLWHTEDAIRMQEQLQRYDAAFVALARAVIRQNEVRAGLKRDISLMLGSRLVEQKHYRGADWHRVRSPWPQR